MMNFYLPFTQNSFTRSTTSKISNLTNEGIYRGGNYSTLQYLKAQQRRKAL